MNLTRDVFKNHFIERANLAFISCRRTCRIQRRLGLEQTTPVSRFSRGRGVSSRQATCDNRPVACRLSHVSTTRPVACRLSRVDAPVPPDEDGQTTQSLRDREYSIRPARNDEARRRRRLRHLTWSRSPPPQVRLRRHSPSPRPYPPPRSSSNRLPRRQRRCNSPA